MNENETDGKSQNKKSAIDKELAQMLMPLKQIQPDPGDMSKWKSVVMSTTQQNQREVLSWKRFKLPLQLVAAMLVGVLIGAGLFKNFSSGTNTQEWTQTLTQDATFERTRTNLN